MGTRRIAVLALVLCSAWSCSSDSTEETDLAADSADMMPPAPPAASAGMLTDPQIAHAAVTANNIDIETARMAQTKSSTQSVDDFAQTMITDHTAVNDQATALAQRLGVTPEDNDTSRSMQTNADSVQTRLEGLTGAAFDRAYIDHEVMFHQQVLDALDNTLIPGAQNAELKALLEQTRPAVAAHLDRARSLQGTLGTGQ